MIWKKTVSIVCYIYKRIVLLMSDCVNAFNTYTFKKIVKSDDELYNISEIEYKTFFDIIESKFWR